MFNRRREDRAFEDLSATGTTELPPIPQLAVSWLQDLLRTEFADAPEAPQVAGPRAPAVRAAEEGEADQLAVWRREWLRRWRRLQVPEQLAAFTEALEEVRHADEVHRALAAHARKIVGAHACLVFLPAGEGARLEPLAEPRLGDAVEGLWLPRSAAARTGLLSPGEAQPGAEHVGVARLFDDVRAVALAAAPYADGALVLVERRREREFRPLDWELLRALCSQAEAALHRVRLLGSLAVTDPRTGGAAPERVEEVLRHGWAGAALGQRITFVVVRLEACADPGPLGEAAIRQCAAALRRQAAGAGPILRHRGNDFVLVLNEDREAAEALLERVRAETEGRCRLTAGIAPHDPAAASPRDLLARAEAALEST